MRKTPLCYSYLACCTIPKVHGSTDTAYMYYYYFKPETLQINPGDKVVWINKSKIMLTAISGANCNKNNEWNSGYLKQEETFENQFNINGEVPHFCIPHCRRGMIGLILIGDEKTAINSDQKKEAVSAFHAT